MPDADPPASRYPLLGPVPDTQWATLSAERRARIMGAAAGLTTSDLNLYVTMAGACNGSGRVHHSNIQLALLAGYSRQEVIRSLQRLKAEWFIHRVKKSNGGKAAAGKANPTHSWAVFMPSSSPVIEEINKGGRLERASRVPSKSSRKTALLGVTRGYTSAKG